MTRKTSLVTCIPVMVEKLPADWLVADLQDRQVRPPNEIEGTDNALPACSSNRTVCAWEVCRNATKISLWSSNAIFYLRHDDSCCFADSVVNFSRRKSPGRPRSAT